MKKTKVTVWVDGKGTTSADTNMTQEKAANMRIKGFQILDTFNVPARYFLAGRGWYPAYRYYLGWAIHAYGV